LIEGKRKAREEQEAKRGYTGGKIRTKQEQEKEREVKERGKEREERGKKGSIQEARDKQKGGDEREKIRAREG
jgi:hypothetical protein